MSFNPSPCVQPLYAIFIFLATFLGGGFYFSLQDVASPWHIISPNTAILPAIIYLFLRSKTAFPQTLSDFLEGVGDHNILVMCCIFLLSGAFGEMTQAAGCAETAARVLTGLLPAPFFLPGIFLLAALISTAIGTSMGVVATVGPLVLPLATSTGLEPSLAMATVVGGAILGDNLSLISDTTIAAVNTVGADLRQKFAFNSKIALAAATLTCALLYQILPGSVPVIPSQTWGATDLVSLIPYLSVILLAFGGMHVINVLLWGCVFSAILIIWVSPAPLQAAVTSLQTGFANLWPITLLSLCIGGMGALIQKQGGFAAILSLIGRLLRHRAQVSQRRVELIMAALVSFYDICIANNTIAILLCGTVTRELADRFQIDRARAATWMGTFSCIFQGLIPYGAQILLASALCRASPLEIAPQVYYNYMLLGVSLAVILSNRRQVMAPQEV